MLSSHRIPVLTRAHSIVLPEHLPEISDIGEPRVIRDFRYRTVFFPEQLCRILQPHGADIVSRGMVKGDHERWAYTVLFSFPRHTLHYFDEGQYAVVVKKFYKNLLGLYVEIAYPDTDMAVRRKKIKEVEEDAGLYKEFLLWANSPESVEKKKQIYISDFVAVFGRFPEGWAQEELESANGTEVAPAPEEFISPETDGAVNMDDPAV